MRSSMWRFGSQMATSRELPRDAGLIRSAWRGSGACQSDHRHLPGSRARGGDELSAAIRSERARAGQSVAPAIGDLVDIQCAWSCGARGSYGFTRGAPRLYDSIRSITSTAGPRGRPRGVYAGRRAEDAAVPLTPATSSWITASVSVLPMLDLPISTMPAIGHRSQGGARCALADDEREHRLPPPVPDTWKSRSTTGLDAVALPAS
jgi:hypothetical protein